MTLKVKKIGLNGAKSLLPEKATAGSAGFDLHASLESPVEVKPGDLVKIPTGIAVGFPGPQYMGLVFARSGLGTKHGITLSNGVGVIDSDYTGELTVGLCNVSDRAYTIEPGERIAQLVVVSIPPVEIEETAELNETARSGNGFGSTGRF